MYFLRNSAEEEVTPQTIAREVNFGMIDCRTEGLLESCESHMSKVVLPVLKKQKVKQSQSELPHPGGPKKRDVVLEGIVEIVKKTPKYLM